MKKIIKISLLVFFILSISSYFLLFFLPKPNLLEDLSFSKTLYDDHGRLLRLTLSKDEKYRLYLPLTQIPSTLIEATLLQEDQYFRFHYGINPVSLVRAIWTTYMSQSRRVGASTLSMQLARMRYSLNSKTVSGKLEQILRAIQIEMHYSKDQILEAYLNLAPYGGNIEGVGAASLIYFSSGLDQLTLPQFLTLSIIPQNPTKRTIYNRNLKTIREHLFQRWLRIHPEDATQQARFQLPLAMNSTRSLPFIAPHFVTKVLHDYPKRQRIDTTLNAQTQQIIERVTRGYLERKHLLGVQNAAVLLVDSRDMAVKALLGSADFFNTSISGQINGVESKRSPGSTLKPFIYALALDQGLIHPHTLLKDVPQSFNGYNPENFDYQFLGPIKAKDALVLSRNIPAIYLANLLTNPTLYQLLEKAQIRQLRPSSYYGLSMALGGVELTMRELVSLYAMLVNDGLWYPVHFLKQENSPKGKRLLSPEASFLVLEMLQSSAEPLAWKTGTSSAYRDAWTVGLFGPYVLAVWIGNFDNTANPSFIGKEIAAPLFFELVSAMKQELGPIHKVQKNLAQLNLKKVKVCKASGMLPTPYCPDTEWTWFIPGKSPIKKDTIYREVAINLNTGLRACRFDKNTAFKVYEFWSSDLLDVFKKAGIQRNTPPAFEAGCHQATNKGINPKIASPQLGFSYMIKAKSPRNSLIPFSAVSDAGVSHLYWFINDVFIAKTSPHQTYLWQALAGKYVVRVVDDRGLSDAREIQVTLVS